MFLNFDNWGFVYSDSSLGGSLAFGFVVFWSSRWYLWAFESMSSFSKSLRSDLKIFLVGWLVFSAISVRVSSLCSFNAAMTSSSFLFSFICGSPGLVVVWCIVLGVFQFCGRLK